MGEGDLVFKRDQFFLCQKVEATVEKIKEVDHYIGCDFGLSIIVVNSDRIQHLPQ